MTAHICLLNDRACRCDLEASDEKLRPCVLARRIGKLVRLMASDKEHETIGALAALQRVQQTEGFSFNVLANLIESLEDRKYSDSDAKIIFMRGEGKGRREETSKQQAPPEFYDADGAPRWYEIATFCQQNRNQLRSDWEREFVSDEFVANIIKFGRPTAKQMPYLVGIFVKLGGFYDPKAFNLHR
jgi:hypothetical protein